MLTVVIILVIDMDINLKKPEKSDLDSLASTIKAFGAVTTPYLENAISFSNLYKTTGLESYRKEAIENVNSFEHIMRLYSVSLQETLKDLTGFIKETVKEITYDSLSGEFHDRLESLLEETTRPIDLSYLKTYKEYMENLKEDKGGYRENVKLLEKTKEDFYNYIKNTSSNLSDVIKSLFTEE